ncbi:MAG: magnesium/cobalt transporter CorA [Myxococcales bacterium]
MRVSRVARFYKKREENRGLSPGSLVFIGEQKTEAIRVRLFDYDEQSLAEETLDDIGRVRDFAGKDGIKWINVDGLHDTEVIREIGEAFGLHPLLLEDVLNTGQRPKLDEFEDTFFVVVKMLRYDDDSDIVIAEQLSIVVGPSFVLTFQEQPGDVFEPVRERLRNGKGRIRGWGSDYLAYALLDSVVDSYIYIIEKIGEEVEELESEVLESVDPELIGEIGRLKREMSFLRKAVRPAREAILKLSKLDSDLIREATAPFLKDLVDISSQAAEAIETYREMLSDELNIYNSSMSHRMNDIMKVLTIFAAIFIPLTFIAGIYGTNFEYLPELHFRYGYFVLWGVLITVAGSMLYYFKKKGWL